MRIRCYAASPVSATPALLSVNGLALSYGAQRLLDGVTFAIAPGEKAGLVGRNGCGKTSLLKILAGVQEADAGDLSLRRQIRVGYLPQEFELDPNLTVRQNIEAGAADLLGWIARYEAGDGSELELADLLTRIEAADGWHLDARIRAEADALRCPPLETVVGPLSGGEKRRVALCRALAAQPDLLLLDEPTNHLDADTIRWLEEFLRDFQGAVIFVTHDRYFLDVIATRIIELDAGRAFAHPGNYTAFLEAKAVRRQIAEQGERRRQRFLREELEWVRAGVRAQRSKSRHRLESFYAVEGLEAPPEEREMDLLLPPAPEIGNEAVELRKVGARVQETEGGERWLFRHLSLVLKPGTCTGIVGPNGAGKTTLLRLCMGEREPEEGAVSIAKKAQFNYIDQARMQLNGSGRVIDEVSDADEVTFFGDQRLSARGYLRRFLFSDDRANERVDRLSGGERARLLLAKVLRRGGNVIILDEPTNDLDLPSLRMLEEALVDFDGCVLVVSHDRYFLDRVCDQIVAFEDGQIFVQPGNYSYYLEKRREREQALRQRAAAPPTPVAPVAAKDEKPKKLSFKEKQELDGMEAQILAAEERVGELDAMLNDPAFYVTRSQEAAGLVDELERTRADVARLYARWEELGQRA